MKEPKIKYQALVKWYIDNRINKSTTGWMYYEGANKFYNTYKDALMSVKKEISRRLKTEQPVISYKIIRVYTEVIVEVII